MNLFEQVTKIGKGYKIIKEWLGAGGIAVDRTLAQSRADTCLKCPENRIGGAVLGSVSRAISEHVQLKNEMGLRVFGEKSLYQCQICLCPTRLKIWCPMEHILHHTEKEELDKLPRNCWIIKES